MPVEPPENLGEATAPEALAEEAVGARPPFPKLEATGDNAGD